MKRVYKIYLDMMEKTKWNIDKKTIRLSFSQKLDMLGSVKALW